MPRTPLAPVLALACLFGASAAPSVSWAEEKPVAYPASGDYEIIKATADRVWRLNKRTGEIAACAVEGTQLVCAVAQETTGGKKLTPEDMEARRKLAAEADRRRREDEMKKDLAFMDRMIELFREFMKAAAEREAAASAPPK